MNDVVASFTRVRVRETVPDRILDRAETEVVDIPPYELIERLRAGDRTLGVLGIADEGAGDPVRADRLPLLSSLIDPSVVPARCRARSPASGNQRIVVVPTWQKSGLHQNLRHRP